MSGDPRILQQLAAVKRAVAALESMIGQPDQQSRLLKVKEVAQLLGRHERSARKLMKRSGRAEMISGRLYIDRAHLSAIGPVACGSQS